MPARKYSDELCEEAARLKELGMSDGAIATRLGMSQGAVFWACLRLGADSPNTVKNLPARQGPMVFRRKGYDVRRFSIEEDQRLLELEAKGLTRTEIARELGRKPNSVRGRLLILARHDARREAIAETMQS